MEQQETITHRKATEVFQVLQYWVRATRFEPTEAERALIGNCEKRSARNTVLGAIFGGSSAFAIAKNIRMPMLQAAALGGAGALIGSIYGQFQSNQPCLCELLELGKKEHSPLAEQARGVLQFGAAQMTRALRDGASEHRSEGRGVTPVTQPPLAARGSATADPWAQETARPATGFAGAATLRSRSNDREAGESHDARDARDAYDAPDPHESRHPELDGGAAAVGSGAAVEHDSWAQVRRRYREQQRHGISTGVEGGVEGGVMGGAQGGVEGRAAAAAVERAQVAARNAANHEYGGTDAEGGVVDSWEAVRQLRLLDAKAGARAAGSESHAAPLTAEPRVGGRRRKNAYGDDIFSE